MTGINPEFRSGYVVDYISREQVKATPEEIDAVQVFSQRLVEDFGYTVQQIQTRPQFRVRSRPSDEGGKAYPIDIAVFKTDQKTEDNLFIIVECKKRNRKDGVNQLKLYMDMSPAEIGVWFNGEDHVYIRKILHSDGTRTYEDLPNIPRRGQRIEDIGLYRRRDLKEASNLKAVFKDIRNNLAGNVTGITRDESLAQEIVNLLFCKIYDEVNTGQDEIVTFRSGHNEYSHVVQARIFEIFTKVKVEYGDVFAEDEVVRLDATSVAYVVGELQNYCITEANRDAVGDAFEVFIGPALRGAEGQFFTPRNVVKMIIDILDPEIGDLIIDPACGSGGFLIMALEHVWQKLEKQAIKKGWSPVQLERKKCDAATRYFRGLDKDSFLAKVTKAYMAVIGDGRGGVFCENSLQPPVDWSHQAQDKIKLGTFDVVLTNPPFGAKIPIKGNQILSQYDLGYKWQRNKDTGLSSKTNYLHEDQSPQILFLERCLQLLKTGGRLGIVLPESMISNPSYTYILSWLMERATLNAVVTLPESLFKTSGKGGTHTKVCALFLTKQPKDIADHEIFMADAKWCGHDSRGNPTMRKNELGEMILLDDVPVIVERHTRLVKSREDIKRDHLGFLLKNSSLKNYILVPKYYDPEITDRLNRLNDTHTIIQLTDLVRDGVVSIATGVEVGKMAYGTGAIPFIRTSDISNWELKIDPKQGVSEEIYQSLRTKAAVQPGDILMVRDGTYLIGTSAIITESDTKILFQSHIYRIRILKPTVISPWLLFACLNSPVVKRQIRAKQFTQDIIDTLGNRILELDIPIPNDQTKKDEITKSTKEIVEGRVALRNKAKQVAIDVEGTDKLDSEDEALLDIL